MLIDFATALEVGDRDAIRRVPKADLHIHGLGGGDRAFFGKGHRKGSIFEAETQVVAMNVDTTRRPLFPACASALRMKGARQHTGGAPILSAARHA
jgi:hypothetical protein